MIVTAGITVGDLIEEDFSKGFIVGWIDVYS